MKKINTIAFRITYKVKENNTYKKIIDKAQNFKMDFSSNRFDKRKYLTYNKYTLVDDYTMFSARTTKVALDDIKDLKIEQIEDTLYIRDESFN